MSLETVTAPTQPPDPRVQRIADALDVWSDTVGYESHRRLARVLVEELGAREMHRHAEYVSYAELTERNATQERRIIAIHAAIDDALGNGEWRGTTSKEYVVGDAEVIAIRTLAAQQRENAETIAALKERVETAEAANTELDNARKSAEQSARDLRENNASLRAELDAIKGAQVPFAYGGNNADGFPVISLSAQAGLPPLYRHPAPPHNLFAAFIDALKADRDMQWYYHCNVAMAACDKGVPHDQANAAAFLFMERLLGEYTPLHAIPEYTPAPALPVVGACVVKDGKPLVTYTNTVFGTQADKEAVAMDVAKSMGATAHIVHLGAPLPTEGGK